VVSVLQASAWYPPVTWGGTEVYVSGLVRELRGQGVTSNIVAPLGPQQPDGYRFEDSMVRTYSVNAVPTRAEQRGDKVHDGFSRFREILTELQPDVYHQHSWSRGLGLAHLRLARELGLRTVLTVHVPGVTCMRGTMMRFGTEVCDGRIERFRCAACWSHSRGIPKPLALALAAVSSRTGSVAPDAMPQNRLTTALSAAAMVERLRTDVAAMSDYADRIVAVCQWLHDTLLLNGVPPEKLVLNRQGVDGQFVAAVADASSGGLSRPDDVEPRIFRLLYLGRWQPVKGLDVLVRAVKAVPPETPLELLIHGVGGGPEERDYEAKVRRIAGNDRRIRIAPPVSRPALAETFLQANALAVPSRWLETGPLVVLEAQAAGLPILGSRLGGIAELVREPDDGLLVEPDDVVAWTNAILQMVKTSRPNAPRVPAKVRTMRSVAIDMSGLYRELRDAPARSEAFSCVSR